MFRNKSYNIHFTYYKNYNNTPKRSHGCVLTSFVNYTSMLLSQK